MTSRIENVSAPTRSHENAIGVNVFPCFQATSFIHVPGADTSPWFDVNPAAFIYFAPKPEPMSPGDLRASLLHAAEYLDASLDAMIEGDDGGVVDALEVLRGIVAVVLGQMRAPSENRVLQ
jgi:hypothetical protein